MKRLKLYPYLLLFLVLTGLSINACKDDKQIEEEASKYYISSAVKSDISAQKALETFTDIAPEAVLLGSLLKYDVEVRTVNYKTVFKDKNIMVSGLICLPKQAGNYPIISFQNGTNTLHSDAPSVSEDDLVLPMIESVASMGFIVVIPDYIGFGASSNQVHPYLDAKSSTQCILDMIRAAKEYTVNDKVVAKATNDLFIFGYSQGGWATMQVQKTIEKEYSTEFNLVASSCGGGPYSIEYMNRYIVELDEYPMPFFIGYILNSYKSIGYITNPISDIIQEPYASLIPTLFDGTNSSGTINSKLTPFMSKFFTEEYRSTYSTNTKFAGLKASLLSNSITAWKASTPMKLFHGANDEYIPVGVSQKIFQDFKTAGVPASQIELTVIPNTDHTSAVYTTGLQTMIWFYNLKE